jgi:uracil-DNA glycosylase
VLKLAAHLVDAIPAGLPGLYHPWRDRCPQDARGNGPQARLARLAAHLDCDARWILVGEAPGYQGCRYSGIAFTSERLLLEGAIPRLPAATGRLSRRERPFSEPSATIVWKALDRAGIADCTVMWNALQLHPHNPGQPWSNRTPSAAELARGEPAMRRLTEAFPGARVIAVGRKAERLLSSTGVTIHAAIRHPANGGATAFAAGLLAAVAGKGVCAP